MVKQLANGFAFVSLILFSACQSNLSPQPVTAQQRSGAGAMAEPVDRSPLKLPLVKPRIVVKKGQRHLHLLPEEKLRGRNHIGVACGPSGDKAREGDRRTPAGVC